MTVFSVVIIVMAIIIVVTRLINVSENNMVKLKENLPGSNLETYHSKTQPPLFSNIYYYHALKFNDDGTLDYYYVSTGGPREDDEPLEYVDTYTYSLSKKFITAFSVILKAKNLNLKSLELKYLSLRLFLFRMTEKVNIFGYV